MKGKKLQPRIPYPARLSFRFDGEIQQLSKQTKVKRIQHYQSSFTINGKGTSLGGKQEEEKTYLKKINPKQLRKCKRMVHVNSYLKYKWINAPTKRNRLAEQMQTCACMHFQLPRHSAWTQKKQCNYITLLEQSHSKYGLQLQLSFIFCLAIDCEDSLVAQKVKSLPTMWETRKQSLGLEDPLEK